MFEIHKDRINEVNVFISYYRPCHGSYSRGADPDKQRIEYVNQYLTRLTKLWWLMWIMAVAPLNSLYNTFCCIHILSDGSIIFQMNTDNALQINASGLSQHGHHFADVLLKSLFLNFAESCFQRTD